MVYTIRLFEQVSRLYKQRFKETMTKFSRNMIAYRTDVTDINLYEFLRLQEKPCDELLNYIYMVLLRVHF